MARDVLLMFGDISLATKNTAAYSADSLDTNTPAVKYTGRTANVNVVFSPKAAFAATDGYVPIVQDSADGDSWATIMEGGQVDKPAKGAQYVLPIPVSHRRYLRVGATPVSSDTFTAVAVTAWIELGK